MKSYKYSPQFGQGTISKVKIKKLQTIRRKHPQYQDNAAFYATIGVESVRDMSEQAADQMITLIEKDLAANGTPNIPPGRISDKMRRGITRMYKYKLGWADTHFWNWAQKVIGHEVPKRCTNFQKFNWCTPKDGRKMYEGLKAMCRAKGLL